MTLRVVGAGLGRTGTHSLKLALEQLLGGPCYHMLEVFQRPEDIPVWQLAAEGNPPDWADFLSGYRATVDWPASAFWRELAATNPEAIVLLSVRDPDEWWTSAKHTIFDAIRREPPADDAIASAQLRMINTLLQERFTRNWSDEDTAKAAYERHNQQVRALTPPEQLVEWAPSDGWRPLCAALKLPVPDEPFPHVNTTAEFRAMTGLDAVG